MPQTHTHKIIIVGGGPAGIAAALHIARLAPALVPGLVVLEAAEYPRPKLCGGGITVHGETQLAQLGVTVDVPAFVVERIAFRLGRRQFTVPCRQAMRIIQRADFDAALARTARARGICIQTGSKVRRLTPADGGVTVTTDRAVYSAPVVIGADGANSLVRRHLAPGGRGVARLLRVMTPLDPAHTTAWQTRQALFDFSCVLDGVQGYEWDFPCYFDGRPMMNRGIFDSRAVPTNSRRPHGHFKSRFAAGLAERDVDLATTTLEGHPVRWFDPAGTFSRPHILLTGDAAGVDSLFAEGISFALEYGAIVAACVTDAFTEGDFRFADYGSRLRRHRLGRLLQRRAAVARALYTFRYPAFWDALWRLAAVAPPRLQRLFGASLGLLPP